MVTLIITSLLEDPTTIHALSAGHFAPHDGPRSAPQLRSALFSDLTDRRDLDEVEAQSIGAAGLANQTPGFLEKVGKGPERLCFNRLGSWGPGESREWA